MIAREDSLAAFEADRFDVVVIGGGITGAGVALDAASRGYSVALVEREDFAAGTSSRSSKLVHGGLRYLQNFDLGLVREALLERGADGEPRASPGASAAAARAGVRRQAPGPAHRRRAEHVRRDGHRPLRAAATATADEWSPDRHRTISGEEVAELLPALARREPSGGYLFYDCQTDDVRLVLTVLGEAERFGAVLANRLNVLGLIEENGRAAGSPSRTARAAASSTSTPTTW